MARNTETVITKLSEPGTPAEQAGLSCLIVFYGENLGKRYFLNREEVIIGRSDGAHIQVDQESVSRQHVRLRIAPTKVAIADLQSTNGTFVNNTRVQAGELSDGDLIRVGQTIFKYLSAANIEAKYHEEIYRLSTIDGLTETFNKRYFIDTLERELNRAKRYGRGLSLVLFDIDHFKRVNDTYGHLAGDAVLRELANLVAQNTRRQDTLARYGGEEFAMVLPEVDASGALLLSEKLRQKVEVNGFVFNGQQLRITISLGIASYEQALQAQTTQGLGVEAFIALADARLYEAKQNGRNRVVVGALGRHESEDPNGS